MVYMPGIQNVQGPKAFGLDNEIWIKLKFPNINLNQVINIFVHLRLEFISIFMYTQKEISKEI